MSKRRLIRWSLILAILAAFAVWLEPTRVVWGWLRGEAFYQGRPTSWWERELSYWATAPVLLELVDQGPGKEPKARRVLFFARRPQEPFEWLNRVVGREVPPHTVSKCDDQLGPTLLQGDAAAEPVLVALAQHPVERIRELANHGLNSIQTKQESQKHT